MASPTSWSGATPESAAMMRGGGPFGQFKEFPRWLMYRRGLAQLAGQTGRGLPYGGGGYSGSQGQQFGQGLADLSSALRTAMQDYHTNKVGWSLLNQADPSGQLAQQYKDMGLTGNEAWQEAQANWDAQREMGQQDLATSIKQKQLEQLKMQTGDIPVGPNFAANVAAGLGGKGMRVARQAGAQMVEVPGTDDGNGNPIQVPASSRLGQMVTQQQNPALAAAKPPLTSTAIKRALPGGMNPGDLFNSKATERGDYDADGQWVGDTAGNLLRFGKDDSKTVGVEQFNKYVKDLGRPEAQVPAELSSGPDNAQPAQAETGGGGNQIDPATAQQFLNQAGGDPAKARALAIAAGFTGF